jgi:hypothetical protein
MLLLALCWLNVSAAIAKNESDPGTNTDGTVLQAHVDHRIIHIPVIDGKGVRFTRLSKEDGVSQTKIGQIVQDDQVFMWLGTKMG